MKLQRIKPTQTLAMLPALVAFILLGISAARAAYPDVILSNNPSAYYRLEEMPGATTAVDSSTNGVNATYFYNLANTSPALEQPGIDSNSIAFNGTDPVNGDYGYVSIPASTLITPVAADGTSSGAFSEEMWIKVNSQPATWSVPIEVAQYPNGWNIYVSGADAGNGAASWFYLDMRPPLFQGVAQITFLQWNHVVVTFDGTNALVYVNGVQHGPYAASGFVPAIGSNAHVGSGQGAGWKPLNGSVDEVAFYTNVLTPAQVLYDYQVGTNSFRAQPTPPSDLADPASTTNYSGLPVSFTMSADGTLPLHYQWFKNSTPVGANSSALNFTCQYPADNNASIQVIVTNNFGSVTSAVATLTVLTNVNIPGAPNSIVRNVGSYAAFHVTAFGAVPITYQWSLSTDGGTTFTNLSGQTNDTLWLSNVQMAQNGNQFAVTVGGPFSSDSVSPATLNVQARTESVPLTGYGAIVAADKPVAFWRLDETAGSSTAVDAVGTFDGAYTPGTLGTVTYGVATGIPKTTDTAVGLANGANVQIPFAPELNSDTTWSIESWVQPASLGANGGDYRVVLSSEYNKYPNPYNGWYMYQQPNNTFAFVPEPPNVFITAGPIVANNWYHIVVTDDGVNFRFYLNGVLATAPYPVTGFVANGAGINQDGTAGITSTLGNTVLGQRTDGAFNTFEGTVDDTAVYNYALTPDQVYSHFIVATKIAISKSGTNVVLTWPVGTLQQATSVSGAYTNVTSAASPYTNSASGTPKYYRVHVP